MIIFLIGICGILVFLAFIYLLGVAPNLWSNLTVNPKCIKTVLEEGFSNFWKLFVLCTVIACVYGMGLLIYSWTI